MKETDVEKKSVACQSLTGRETDAVKELVCEELIAPVVGEAETGGRKELGASDEGLLSKAGFADQNFLE